MKQWGVALALCSAGWLLSASAGCRRPEEPLRQKLPPPALEGMTLNPLAGGAKLERDREYTILVRLQLITMELPEGATSHSEELWSYLNEEPVGGRVSSTLWQNGIRVGLGREADWPEIRQILSRLMAKSLYRWNMNHPPGDPVSVPLKKPRGVQTIFLLRADRTLIGYDYPAGDNVLTLVPTVDYDNPAAVHVAGAVTIRSARQHPQYVQTPAGYVLTHRPVHYRLPAMDFGLLVPAGGFVLVGPSSAAERESSPGAAFLIHEKDGVKFEKVLVILPEVFAAPVRPAD